MTMGGGEVTVTEGNDGPCVTPDALMTAFGRSDDAVLVGASGGRTLRANRAACELFGYAEQELLNLGCDGLSDRTDPAWVAALAERAVRGWVRATLPMVKSDGTSFCAEVASAIFPRPGDGFLSWVTVRDVSEATGRQHHLEVIVEQLETALHSRVVIEQAKGFIAAVHGIDTEAAYDRLRKYARNHQANIHDISQAITNRQLLL